MRNGSSGNKRKAATSETAVPAKWPANVAVPEHVAALLETMASSLNAATLDLMDLQCTDFAARDRVLAVMTDCKRQLNNVLGIKRRSVLDVGDVIIDVFQFLRRQDLDTLQIVSVRLNAIIKSKLTLVCLRHLKSAKMLRSGANFVLLMDEIGAKKTACLPTGVDDEAAATTLLLDACQSSRVDSLELYGTTPMSGRFFNTLALRAQTIFADELCTGKRTLSSNISDAKLLRMLQSFAELKTFRSKASKDVNLQYCLMRCCFKVGVSLTVGLRPSEFDKICDPTAVEDALLEFCFDTCDEQYATRERRLSISLWEPLESDFLQRWIENAEVTDCRHKLTLDIIIWEGWMSQDTDALDAYMQDGESYEEVRFESVRGRHWSATYSGSSYDRITLQINH